MSNHHQCTPNKNKGEPLQQLSLTYFSIDENNKALVARIFFLFFLFPLARIDIFVAVNNLLQSTIYRR